MDLLNLALAMVDGEWRGPNPPKWGKWVESKPGPRGGKRWRQVTDGGDSNQTQGGPIPKPQVQTQGQTQGQPQVQKPKAKPKVQKPQKPTADGMFQTIQEAVNAGKVVTPDDVDNLANAIFDMTDVEIRNLRAKMGLTKTGGAGARKADRIKGIVDKLMSDISNEPKVEPKPKGKTKPRTIPKPKAQAAKGAKQNLHHKVESAKSLAAVIKSKDHEPTSDQMVEVARMVQSSHINEQRVLLDTLGLQHVKDPLDTLPALVELNSRSKFRTEEEWRQHPTLKIMGDKLTIKGIEDSVTQKNLKDLSAIPEAVVKRVSRRLNEVAVGNVPITELDSNEYLRGVTPRGWGEGSTWDTVAGAYCPSRRTVTAGKGRQGSESLALHEYGHAVGHIGGFDYSEELADIHRKIYEKLPLYLQQGGPGGLEGRQELFAEGFATVIKDRNRAVSYYGERFVNWMETNVLNGF